jgi:hypothetical protein
MTLLEFLDQILSNKKLQANMSHFRKFKIFYPSPHIASDWIFLNSLFNLLLLSEKCHLFLIKFYCRKSLVLLFDHIFNISFSVFPHLHFLQFAYYSQSCSQYTLNFAPFLYHAYLYSLFSILCFSCICICFHIFMTQNLVRQQTFSLDELLNEIIFL